MEFRDDNVVDLNYEFNENTIYWPSSNVGFQWKSIFTGRTAGVSGLIDPIHWIWRVLFSGFMTTPMRYFISEGSFSQPEHMGTHMDAPRHFAEHGVMVSDAVFRSFGVDFKLTPVPFH